MIKKKKTTKKSAAPKKSRASTKSVAARKKAATTKSASRKGPAKRGSGKKELIKLKNILVPIDFSDCSMKALDYAVAFAQQFKARITLLYVVDLPIVASEMGMFIDQPSMEAEFRDNANAQLHELVRSRIAKKAKADTIISCGRAHPEIIETAKTTGMDMIIIATHGYSGFQKAFMGGTTEKVVRHAPCPVLVVREKEHEFI